MRDDAELVDLALQGDSAAFAELYERYFDRVYDFLARMVRDRDEAADLAQDTFVRAMNNLSSLTKGSSFKSWLFTIARNTALNRLERASRTQPLEHRRGADEDDEVQMDVIDEDRYGNPEEAAQVKSYASLVWEAATSLEPRQYAVLDFSVRQQLTNDELAEVLGVSKNNAAVMVNRMKKALEGAIGSLVLLREGRRQCAELEVVLQGLQVAEMTPDVRKAIDRHASKCDACNDRRRNLASPFGIFAGLALVQPVSGAKAAIFETLSASFAQTYGGGAGAVTGSAGPSPQPSPNLGEGATDAGSPNLDEGTDGGPASLGHGTAGEEAVGPGATANTGGGYTGGYGGGIGASSGVLGEPEGDAPPPPSKWPVKLAAVVVAAILLLGGGFIAYSMGFDDGDGAQSAVQASPTAETLAAILGASPTPPATPTASLQTPSPAPETSGGGGDFASEADPPAGPTEDDEPNLVAPPADATATPEAPSPTPATPTVTPTPCLITLNVTPNVLDYGASRDSLQFSLTASGCPEPISFEIQPGNEWIVAEPSSGEVPADGTVIVTVRILRREWEAANGIGFQTARLSVNSVVGPIPVEVFVEFPAPPTPTTTPTPTATPFPARLRTP